MSNNRTIWDKNITSLKEHPSDFKNTYVISVGDKSVNVTGHEITKMAEKIEGTE